MTLDEAIQHCWDEAEKNRARANDYSDAHDQENEKACNACAVEHAPLAVWAWLIELRQRRAAEQDSLDAMCSQIKKVIRTESDDGDWYAALLKDGSTQLPRDERHPAPVHFRQRSRRAILRGLHRADRIRAALRKHETAGLCVSRTHRPAVFVRMVDFVKDSLTKRADCAILGSQARGTAPGSGMSKKMLDKRGWMC